MSTDKSQPETDSNQILEDISPDLSDGEFLTPLSSPILLSLEEITSDPSSDTTNISLPPGANSDSARKIVYPILDYSSDDNQRRSRELSSSQIYNKIDDENVSLDPNQNELALADSESSLQNPEAPESKEPEVSIGPGEVKNKGPEYHPASSPPQTQKNSSDNLTNPTNVNYSQHSITPSKDTKCAQPVHLNERYVFSWQKDLRNITDIKEHIRMLNIARDSRPPKCLPTHYRENISASHVISSLIENPHFPTFFIYFYTFMQEKLWKQLTHVSIRIGHDYYNQFRNSYGSFEQIDTIWIKDACFIVLFLKLQTPIFKNARRHFPLPYKYHFRFRNGESSYEDLYFYFHGRYYDTFNRFLHLDLDPIHLLKDRIYTHFDLIILPNKETQGLWGKVEYGVQMLFENVVPHQSLKERMFLALVIFLPNYFKMGASCETCNSIEDFFDKFKFLTNEFTSNQLYSYGNKNDNIINPIGYKLENEKRHLSTFWLKEYLFPLMAEQLDSLTIYLFVSLTLLIMDEHYLQGDMNLMDHFTSLLRNCVEKGIKIAPLQGYLSKPDISVNSIHNLFVKIIFKIQFRRLPDEEFVMLFPFYHSMFYLYIDFNQYHLKSEYLSEHFSWGIPECYHDSYGQFEFPNRSKLFALLNPAFGYNILPFTIIYFSSLNRYPELMSSLNIPYSYFLQMFLYYTMKLRTTASLTLISKQIEIRTICLAQICSGIHKDYKQIPITEFELLFNLAVRLLLETEPFSKNLDQRYIITLLNLISRTVFILYRIHYSIDDSHQILKKREDLIQYFNKFCKVKVTIKPFQLKHMLEELERWDIAFCFEFPTEYDWNKMIGVILRARLSEFLPKEIFSMICNIHTDGKLFSPYLKETLIDEVSDKITQSNQLEKEMILKSICSAELKPDHSYSRIFSDILLSQKDDFSLNPFSHLILCKSWLFLFPIYFSEKSKILFDEQAISFFDDVILIEYSKIVQRILTFTISLSEIKCYFSNRESFTELLSKAKPFLTRLKILYEDVENCINTSSKCLIFFDQQVKNLQIFEQFPVEICMPFSKVSLKNEFINQICIFSNNKFEIILDSNFNKLVNSEDFNDIVNCNLQFLDSSLLKLYIESKAEILSCQIFSYEEFISSIWMPMINEMDSLLISLSDLSITIADTKQKFEILEVNSELSTELNTIRDEIARLRGSNYNISHAVEIIPKLFTLISLSKIIELIASTWKIYKFTSDSSMMHQIWDTIKHMDTLKLGEIPQDVFTKNQMLINLNDLHKKFLFEYNLSQGFVCWVKENLHNIKEIKSFVDLASTTCGDNPTDIGRITCLLTVCTELQPMIYLPITTDFSGFIKELENLTPILLKTPKLPKMLRDVSRALYLWEDLINAKSSIEEDTMSLMNKIVTNSTLHIELPPKSNEIVRVIMIEEIQENQKNAKVLYFDQLDECLSKFMLLSQGSNYTTKYSHSNLDIFPEIYEKIVIFTKILQNLYKLDHPDYAILSISIPFNEGSMLDHEISKAKSKLDTMSENITNNRQEEYFLSYYTTAQLVYIKRVLNSILIDIESIEDQQVYHLLSIVNPGITKDLILYTIQWLIENEKVKSDQSASDVQTEDTVVSDSFELTEEDLILVKEVKADGEYTESHINLAIRELKREGKTNITDIKVVRWCTRHAEPEISTEEETDIHGCHSGNLSGQINVEDIRGYKFENFSQVGAFLSLLNRNSESLLKGERKFPDHLVLKEPNLILLPSDEIFNFAIHLFSLSCNLPLPFQYEILICEETTTCEELDIFWKRALTDNSRNNYHIYCLLHAEKLTFETSKAACRSLSKYTLELEAHPRYKLVILCSEEQEQQCYMASALDKYKKLAIREYNTDKISNYLSNKLSKDVNTTNADAFLSRLFISTSFGAGKSIFINKMKARICELSKALGNEFESTTISLYGNRLSQESILNQIVDTRIWNSEQVHFYHIDIASTIQHGIESFLFKLIVLGSITNSDGLIWTRKNTDFYAYELTVDLLQPQTHQFIRQFPYFHCLQPIEMLNQLNDPNANSFDESILSKIEYQRVYSYLNLLEAKSDLDSFVYNPDILTIDHPSMVRVMISQCGIRNPSWTEVSYFVEFLNKQLADCEKSNFCQMAAMGEEWRGFKSFVLRLMIHMSRDFATPSLERPADSEGLRYEIIERRKWENSSHPYIFFNPDGHTMTFLGFWVDGRTTNLLNSDDTSIIIEERIMSKNLFLHLQDNRVDLHENFQKLSKKELILKLTRVMGCEHDFDPDPNYVITLDNARKILGIHMRFRCNIPVIIMGETGCGKTHLIEYMCALQAYSKTKNNLLIMKIHGGTTEKEIIDTVLKAQTIAKYNSEKFDIDTIVFFDEANTSQSISLIKEIMCDHRIYGKQISRNNRLQFIAACNPYRRHSNEMIEKLNQAGLGYFRNKSVTSDITGGTPLRNLVYRVLELPESLGSLVWDFGTLNQVSESKYIIEMVARYIDSMIGMQDSKLIKVISNILCEAQYYMRCRDDECSYVSLRDVDRTMRVIVWFFNNLKTLNPEIILRSKEWSKTNTLESNNNATFIGDIFDDSSESESFTSSFTEETSYIEFDIITSSVILALSVCYRSRLQDRDEFDVTISKIFQHPLQAILKSEFISKFVEKYYKILFKDMNIGTNIADNHALKENIFMMFICTELKIPLFIVGKPGSSKSLSKTIISDSMQGNRSLDGSILTNFKQVHMISYQCSHLSTSEGIIDVFKKCAAFQKGRNPKQFVSCVVLDEVGLAEDSPKLPLKVLHPLLDDSIYIHQNIIQSDMNTGNATETDFKLKSRSEEDIVAFIGISNWALDPAKMNRGIMLIRDEPNRDQLISTAKGILKSDESKKIKHGIKEKIYLIADSYLELLTFIRDNSKATKDFYGLRDFYSLIKMLVFLCKHFHTKLNPKILQHSILRNFSGMGDINSLEFFDIERIAYNSTENKGPEFKTLDLIKANLTNYESTFYGENRYLLLLTENLVALDIVLSSPNIWSSGKRQDLRVLFGSSFPDDQHYSVICRNINKIKVYMETGKTVILINLDNLYESLYDALNQYYMHIYGNRYIDLGLGTHRVKCKVHDDFKLVIIADKETVFKKFPPPLVNRLEKHTLLISTILPEHTLQLKENLSQWALEFSTPIDIFIRKRSGIKIADCFIGYQPDTPATIIYSAMKEMDANHSDGKQLFDRCKSLLLKLATVDAVLRLELTDLKPHAAEIVDEYFNETKTITLENYLSKVLNEKLEKHIYLIQATTHSRLLNDYDIAYLNKQLNTPISVIYLQQFQTNQGFVKNLLNIVKKSEREISQIIIIQSESGELNKDLISAVRYSAYEEIDEFRERNKSNCKIFIVILAQLQKRATGSEFSGYHGGDVDCIHIDSLLNKDNILPPLQDLSKMPLYELFSSRCEVVNRKDLIANCIQQSISLIDDCYGSDTRTLPRLKDTVIIFQEQKYDKILLTIYMKISNALRDIEADLETQNWIKEATSCWDIIQASGSFQKALVTYIYRQITPIFTELLALLDRNGNLLLYRTQQNYPVQLNEFWEILFSNDIFLFSIENFIHGNVVNKRVPMSNDGADGLFFQALFPFSWLIFKTVSELWYTFCLKDGYSVPLQRFQNLFDNSLIGQLINDVLMKDVKSDEFLEYYLKDFIKMSMTFYDEEQFKVYEATFQYYFKLSEENFGGNTIDPIEGANPSNFNLSIPLIHFSYHELREVFTYLQMVFSYNRGISRKLSKDLFSLKDDPKKFRNLYRIEHLAMELMISYCKYEAIKVSNPAIADEYTQEIRSYNELFIKGLNLDRSNCIKDYNLFKESLQSRWDEILVIQLFISKICLKNGLKFTSVSLNKLFKLLKGADFSSDDPMLDIVGVVRKLYSSGKTSEKYLEEGDHFLVELGDCITEFLRYVITTVVLKYDFQEDLVIYLTKFITLNLADVTSYGQHSDGSTAKLDIEYIPPFHLKMFILHILLRTRLETMMTYISKYLEQLTKETSGTEGKKLLQDIYLMIIYSIEDSHYYKLEEIPVEDQLTYAEEQLKQLDQNSLNHPNILNQLSSVAKFRFLCMYFTRSIILAKSSQDPKFKVKEFITIFKNLIELEQHQEIHDFLYRCVYQRLGFDIFLNSNQIGDFPWIIPKHCYRSADQVISPDVYEIYGRDYQESDKFLETCLRSSEIPMEMSHINTNILTLSMFNCALNLHYKNPPKYTSLDKTFFHMIKEEDEIDDSNMDKNPHLILKKLIFETFLGTDVLRSENIAIARLLFNLGNVLISQTFPEIFFQISLICTNPESILNTYFPTMEESGSDFAKEFSQIRDNITGNWYKCKNGHIYFIGDCGRAWTESNCPECGDRIGGKYHNLIEDNVCITQDMLGTGYTLKNHDLMNIFQSERQTPPIGVVIIQILLHSTFLITSLISGNSGDFTCLLSTLKIEDTSYIDFFSRRLSQDISHLMTLTHKTCDEALLCIHLILRNFLNSSQIIHLIEFESIELNYTVEDRAIWEQKFYEEIILPALREANDPKDPETQLYMKFNKPRSETDSPFWENRSFISIENYKLAFLSQSSELRQTFPVQNKLMKQDHLLLVTKHLPKIIRLREMLMKDFGYRIDKEYAKKTPLEELINSFPAEKKSVMDEYDQCTESLFEALEQTREDLYKHGRIPIDRNDSLHLSNKSSLIYFISTSSKESSLVSSLIDLLVCVHNSFIHEYEKKETSYTAQKINLLNIQDQHMINFQEYYLSLILSHVKYPLTLIDGDTIAYRFENIEEEFGERFIRMAPIILYEVALFQYKREAYDPIMLNKVKQNVKQECIDELNVKFILENLDSIDTISEILSLIDVVIGFLASAGANPNYNLFKYITEVLCYEDTYSSKVKEIVKVVQLKNLLQFWNIISFEKAKRLALNRQDPFAYLDNEFFEQLEQEQIDEINNGINKYHIDTFLHQLHDFIQFQMRKMEKIMLNYDLKSSIVVYAEDNDIQLPQGFTESFPDSPTISQTISVWTHLTIHESQSVK